MVQMFLDMSPNAGISPNSIPAIHIEIKKNRENNSEMKKRKRESHERKERQIIVVIDKVYLKNLKKVHTPKESGEIELR